MQHNLPENIKTNRKRMSLTQEQLAEAMGVSVGTISKWENGNCVPDINMMMDLADFFSLSVDSLVGHHITSKSVDDILENIMQLHREHKIDELKELSDKVLVRYPYNIDVLKKVGITYKLLWLQNKDDENRQKALEIFRRSLSLAEGKDSIKDEIEIRKEIALLQKNKAGAVTELKKININGVFNDLLGEILKEQGNDEEALECFDKVLNKGVQDITNVAGYILDSLLKRKRYTDCIELTEWVFNIILGMTEHGTVSYGMRWLALIGIVKAVCHELIGEHEKMKETVSQVMEWAKAFDENPVFDIYGGMKFVYGPKNDVPAIWDNRAPGTVSEVRRILKEIVDLKEYMFSSEEVKGIKRVIEFVEGI